MKFRTKAQIAFFVLVLLFSGCSTNRPSGTLGVQRPSGPKPTPVPENLRGGLQISSPGSKGEVTLPFVVVFKIASESRTIELSKDGTTFQTFKAETESGEFTVNNAPTGTYDLVLTLLLPDGSRDPSFRSRITLRQLKVNPAPEGAV